MTSQNILHQYRSYAYHHILLVTDSTSTAEALASSDVIANFQHPRDGSPRFTPKTIGGGKYIVLIDGTTDASLYIERASWEAVLAVGDKQSDGRSLSGANNLEAAVTIVEMNGATFFNLLASLCAVLGSSAQQIYFVIKTIFIGYGDDGDLEPITNIDPFIGSLLDSQAEFGTAGATYQLKFAGMLNGVGHLPSFSRVAGSSIQIGNINENLASAIQSTIAKINFDNMILYNESKSKYAEQNEPIKENETLESRSARIAKFDFTQFEKQNQRVIYDVIIDPVYSDPSYSVAPQRTSSIDKYSWSLEMNKENQVGDIIQALMVHSDKVVRERIDKKEPYEFVITSKPMTDPGTNTVTVQYTVTRKRKIIQEIEQTGELVFTPDVEFLDLNYIFTGKNVDILDFNMSMQFGLSFMEAVNVVPTVPLPNTSSKEGIGTALAMGGNTAIPASPGTNPALLRNVSKNLANNTFIADSRNPALIAQYYAALAQHSAVETLLVKIKIHGNPRFLNRADSASGPPFEYLKINVRMPDPSNPEGAPIPFWYQGLYRVLSYVNEFEQGMFTQTLELNSIASVDGQGRPTAAGAGNVQPYTKSASNIPDPVTPTQISSGGGTPPPEAPPPRDTRPVSDIVLEHRI